MQNQNPSREGFVAALSDRRLISVTGPDAMNFLQNVITHDMRLVGPDRMIYACLLSPQGQFLHDFFIFQDRAEGYFLDVAAVAVEDLLKRLAVFKLRAKVTIEDTADSWRIYVALGHTVTGIAQADPRLPGMGMRVYRPAEEPFAAADSPEIYYDFCIDRGVPTGHISILPQRDVLADVNLDLLNAVGWDKGCYIGQEVTARMRYKALAKKRLFIVSAAELAAGDLLSQNGMAVGEVRQVSANGRRGLAIVRLVALSQPEAPVLSPAGAAVSFEKPGYLPLEQK